VFFVLFLLVCISEKVFPKVFYYFPKSTAGFHVGKCVTSNNNSLSNLSFESIQQYFTLLTSSKGKTFFTNHEKLWFNLSEGQGTTSIFKTMYNLCNYYTSLASAFMLWSFHAHFVEGSELSFTSGKFPLILFTATLKCWIALQTLHYLTLFPWCYTKCILLLDKVITLWNFLFLFHVVELFLWNFSTFSTNGKRKFKLKIEYQCHFLLFAYLMC
jgi:hypothetical protein